jgi:hypothetical protein
LTAFTKHPDEGSLTKRISLVNGKVRSDASGCYMTRGTATRLRLANMRELAEVIEEFDSQNALSLGGLRHDLPDEVEISTKSQLNGAATADQVIARTKENIVFVAGQPALTLFDYDATGMPLEVDDLVRHLGGFEGALISVLPDLEDTARMTRASTSAGLRHAETGKRLPGSSGKHILALIKEGPDNPRFLRDLHDWCWLNGLGWYIVTKSGALHERSIVDRLVGSPERLVFEGPPVLVPPVTQDAKARRPVVFDGGVLDTKRACPPLTPGERSDVVGLKSEARKQLEPEAARIRVLWIDRHAKKLADRTGKSEAEARLILEQQCRGTLLPDVALPFDDPGLRGTTVGDVLADPDRYVGETLADPLKGIRYGRCKAKVLRRRDGSVFIHSFAHGRTAYDIKDDRAVDDGEGVRLEDFRAVMEEHKYIYMPTRAMWPAASVNARVPPVPIYGPDGQLQLDKNGDPKTITATQWLDTYRPVEQLTWAPGLPPLITDRLISEGGWIPRRKVTIFNLYRPPTIEPGDPKQAERWINHVAKVYPHDQDHIIGWLAQRVQHPGDKINHALVLGGRQGIGKDTLIEPVKRAVGPWNVAEVSPQNPLGRFNGFIKSVIMRVSEARDLGDFDRFSFYDHMKSYTTAPPDVLRCDEKYIREHYVLNVTGVIITTNHLTDGIFLPADDRRHYVPWSDLAKRTSPKITGTRCGVGMMTVVTVMSWPTSCSTTSAASMPRHRHPRRRHSGPSLTPAGPPKMRSLPTSWTIWATRRPSRCCN